MGKGYGALFSLVWQRKFLKMKSKMNKVAIATSITMNPWVDVINLAHIKIIFAMCHKDFFMSQIFWKTTSYTQRKRKPFVGCKRKLCVQVFAFGLVYRTTNLTQWKWKPFFLWKFINYTFLRIASWNEYVYNLMLKTHGHLSSGCGLFYLSWGCATYYLL
jgi:hypothetical protein